MRHQDDERGLPHIGAFTRHIRPRDDHRMRFIVEPGIIGNKAFFGERLHDGVTSFRNAQLPAAICDLRTAITVFLRDGGKRNIAVERRDRPRKFLEPADIIGKRFPDLAEKLFFEAQAPLRARQDLLFHCLQFIGDISLRSGKRLTPLIGIRNFAQKRIRDLYRIAEYAVILYFQILYPRLFALFRLHFGDHARPVVADVAQLVKLLAVPFAYVTAFLDVDGRVLYKRRPQKLRHRGKISESPHDPPDLCGCKA